MLQYTPTYTHTHIRVSSQPIRKCCCIRLTTNLHQNNDALYRPLSLQKTSNACINDNVCSGQIVSHASLYLNVIQIEFCQFSIVVFQLLQAGIDVGRVWTFFFINLEISVLGNALHEYRHRIPYKSYLCEAEFGYRWADNKCQCADMQTGSFFRSMLRQQFQLMPISILFVCLSVCLVFNGTFSTNRLYRAMEVGSISCRAGGQYKNIMH